MTSTHTLFCVAITAIAMVAGCSSAPPAAAPAQPQQMLGQPPAGAAAAEEALSPSAEALRRKTEAYAEEVQRLLAERGQAGPTSPNDPASLPWPDAPPRAVAAPVEPADPAPPPPAPGQTARVEVGPPTRAAPFDSPAPVSPPPDRLDQLRQRLAGHIRDYPRDIASHLDYQLLHLVLDEPVPRMAELSALPADDQELIAALLDGLSNFRSGVRAERNMLQSHKVRPLMQMAERLRSQADLNIPTLVLCTRVDGFGVYEPIDPPRFVAGREQPVIIYTELQNFTSTLDEQRRWQTRLRQQAVLYTEDGLNVWQDQAHEIVDQSRNRRHDFFTVRLVRLPATLSVGRYILKITVIDQQAQRVAEASLGIQVVAH